MVLACGYGVNMHFASIIEFKKNIQNFMNVLKNKQNFIDACIKVFKSKSLLKLI